MSSRAVSGMESLPPPPISSPLVKHLARPPHDTFNALNAQGSVSPAENTGKESETCKKSGMEPGTHAAPRGNSTYRQQSSSSYAQRIASQLPSDPPAKIIPRHCNTYPPLALRQYSITFSLLSLAETQVSSHSIARHRHITVQRNQKKQCLHCTETKPPSRLAHHKTKKSVQKKSFILQITLHRKHEAYKALLRHIRSPSHSKGKNKIQQVLEGHCQNRTNTSLCIQSTSIH